MRGAKAELKNQEKDRGPAGLFAIPKALTA